MSFWENYISSFDALRKEVNNNGLKDSTKTVWVKEDGIRRKFNYKPFCKFEKPYELACRGTVIHGIHYITAPRKFFTTNMEGTGEFMHYEKKSLSTYLEEAESEGWIPHLMNKFDGSFIMIYADSQGNFHASTRGSLNNDNPLQTIYAENSTKKTEENLTYSNVSLRFLEKNHPNIACYLLENPYVTCIFELMTPHNLVVTRYSTPSLTPLLFCRNGICYWDTEIFMPSEKFLTKTSSKTWAQDFTDQCKLMLQDPNSFGDLPEGVVVYLVKPSIRTVIEAYPISKLKRKEYLTVCYDQSTRIVRGSDEDRLNCQMLLLRGEHHSLLSEEKYEIIAQMMTDLEKRFEEISAFLDFLDMPNIGNGKELNSNLDKLCVTKFWRNIAFTYFSQHRNFDSSTDFLIHYFSSNDFAMLKKAFKANGPYWYTQAFY